MPLYLMLDIQFLVYVKGCVLEPRQEARLLQNYNAKMEKMHAYAHRQNRKTFHVQVFPP